MSAVAKSNVGPELLAEAIREVVRLKREVKEAGQKVSEAIKKYSDMGVHKRALARVLRDRIREDDEVLAENREYIRMMHIEQHRVTEADLFDDLELADLPLAALEKHALFGAEEVGYAQGKAGGADDGAQRYPIGSPAYVAYAKGYKRGWALRKREDDDETVAAAPTRERVQRPAERGPERPPAHSAPPPAFADEAEKVEGADADPFDEAAGDAAQNAGEALFDEAFAGDPKPAEPEPTVRKRGRQRKDAPPPPPEVRKRGRPPGARNKRRAKPR